MNNDSPFQEKPSVQDLLLHYDLLGIPHFQRGLVWSEENTALLLESLYLDTPCGTIILWEPAEPEKEGVPLSNSGHPRYLVIDGQQRIRSLYNALGPKSEWSAPDSGDDEGGESDELKTPRVWCLNLSRVPELNGLFDAGMSRYPMFRFIADPTREGARIRHNLVPLHFFFDGGHAEIRRLVRPLSTPEEALRRMEEVRLGDGIRSLREKKVFFLKILGQEKRLADVVALYNRINSAGRRVEPEEKAFATLVSLHPPTSQWLRETFKAVHGGAGVAAGYLERDEALERRKERNFGFKLFLRVFIQVCAYRFGYSLGSNSFSFDVVNSLPLQMKLKNPEFTEDLLKRTGTVVRSARKLLEELNCDDLQTLPDTTSLLLLFQVLIRFPKLMNPGYEKVLKCLALRLLLYQNPSQEKILYLVKRVNESETANECFEKLDRKIHGLDGSADLRKELSTWLADSNTLLDRYVLMLYWLLRKMEARDFSYKNLNEEKQKELKPGKEVALNEGVEPEKQHIVPYSLLEKLYNIEKRGRVSRHVANNIGNITYISHVFNSYDKGLGSDPIALSLEDPPNNLERHFLGTAGGVGNAYEKAKEMAANADAGAREEARRAFEEFCGRRRELIREAFVKWVEELGPKLRIEERVEPEELVEPSLQDQVRRLDYPVDVEDAVLELVRNKQLQFARTRRKMDKGLIRKVKSTSDRKGFFIRFLKDQLEVEPATDSALFEALVKVMTAKVGKFERVLPARGEELAITSEILIEFGRQAAQGLTRSDS